MVLRGSDVVPSRDDSKEGDRRYWTPFAPSRTVDAVRDRIPNCSMMISPKTICLMFLRVVFLGSFKDLSNDGRVIAKESDAVPHKSLIF